MKLSEKQIFVSAGPEAALHESLNQFAKELDLSPKHAAEIFPDELCRVQRETLEYYTTLFDAFFEHFGTSSQHPSRKWAITKVPFGQFDGAYLGVLTHEQLKYLLQQLVARYPNLQMPELKSNDRKTMMPFIARMKFWEQFCGDSITPN